MSCPDSILTCQSPIKDQFLSQEDSGSDCVFVAFSGKQHPDTKFGSFQNKINDAINIWLISSHG